MKKIFLAILFIFLVLIHSSEVVDAQFSCTHGSLCNSLSTASTGAVTGTAFSISTTQAVVVSWQVVADGSALSVNLMGSNDNITFFSVDTQATAAGGLKNFGPTALRFLRIDAVSRTGGTITTGSFVVGVN